MRALALAVFLVGCGISNAIKKAHGLEIYAGDVGVVEATIEMAIFLGFLFCVCGGL